MNIKISFIVPFFKVEKYIAECLNSIYDQNISEDEYEVICIDDCSPDNSKEIVKQFQKKHRNLRLIEHDVNKGLGGARNTGLKNAKGTYVWFVDSDDMIKTDCIALLYKSLSLVEIDVLIFNYQRINKNGLFLKDEIVFDNSTIHNGNDYVNSFFSNSFIYHLGYVWRCIYNRDYLLKKNLFFPEKCYWEDTVFFPKAILLADKVMSLSNVFYQYRVNDDSISGNNNLYKADRYFQYAFLAGYDLNNFAEQYKQKDEKLAIQLSLKSNKHFNSFTKPLSLSTFSEKLRFFKLIHKNNVLIKDIKYKTNLKNRLLLVPIFGFILTFLFGILFKLKKHFK